MKLRQWCLRCSAAGITMFLVGVIFYFLVPFIAPGIKPQYENLALYRDWKGWTSTYMLIHPFIYAPVFAAVFVALRKGTAFPAGYRHDAATPH